MTTLTLSQGPGTPLDGEVRQRLEREVLPEFLQGRRWFMAKARTLEATRLVDATGFDPSGAVLALVIVEAEYAEGSPERYFLPLVVREGAEPADRPPGSVLCRLEWPGGSGLLCDAMTDDAACRALLHRIARGHTEPTGAGRFVAEPSSAFGDTDPDALDALPVVPGEAEQSNSTVLYGDRFIFKAFRKLAGGVNPDVEIGLFLTERTDFGNAPRTAGVIEYEDGDSGRTTVGLLQQFVRNDGTGWEHALEVLRPYYERLDENPDLLAPAGAGARPLLELAQHTPPPSLTQHIAEYLPFAVQLGRRLAELHIALAGDATDPAFAPEPLTRDDLATLAGQIRAQVESALGVLRSRVSRLDAPASTVAREVLERSDVLLGLLDELADVRPTSARIRVHGDFHLGQVLRRGDDFVLLDFEGEPTKPLEQRRAKYPAVKDVVGMIRSFDYAAHAALFDFAGAGDGDDAEVFERLAPWASAWQTWISAAFLRQYLNTADGAAFLPTDDQSISQLLRAFMLDKALYELDYELNNRPAWVPIPLQGILSLIHRHESSGYEPDDH